VDPPLGKWIIGLGSQIFGYNAFGWRIMPAVFGTLAILLLVRVTRRMFRSTILGCAAGLLMTLDGMEFVLSRTVLLDSSSDRWVRVRVDSGIVATYVSNGVPRQCVNLGRSAHLPGAPFYVDRRHARLSICDLHTAIRLEKAHGDLILFHVLLSDLTAEKITHTVVRTHVVRRALDLTRVLHPTES